MRKYVKSVVRAAAAMLLPAALTITATPAHATKERVIVVGITDETPHMDLDDLQCVFVYVCFSKKRGNYSYDPGIWGRAKFRAGEVTLRDGTKLAGQVAVLSHAADWNFIKRIALVIPEGEADAIYIGAEDAAIIKQDHKKGPRTYDRYDGAYLQRLVSGTMRLSYNPAAGTSRPISDFVPVSMLNNVSGAAGRQAVIAAMKDGKSVGQSLSDGQSFGSAVSDAIGSIEITQKEYLLYDESAEKLTPITKANYSGAMAGLFAGCAAADAKTVKGFRKYKKIVEAVEYYNHSCG